MLDILSHQGNENQNYFEISSYTCQKYPNSIKQMTEHSDKDVGRGNTQNSVAAPQPYHSWTYTKKTLHPTVEIHAHPCLLLLYLS